MKLLLVFRDATIKQARVLAESEPIARLTRDEVRLHTSPRLRYRDTL